MRSGIIIWSFLLMAAIDAFGQQSAILSQAPFNEIMIDPAVAGSTAEIPLSLQFRRQWSGIDAAPVTQLVSTHSRLGDQLGIGAFIYNDVAGPSRNTGINLGLSYRTKLNDKVHLSFGLAGQLFQYTIDNSTLTTDQPGDLSIEALGGSNLIPDAAAGIMLKGEAFTLGISATNIFNSQQDLFDPSMPLFNSMERTFYLHGRYRVGDLEKTSFEPYLLTRAIQQGVLQFDVGLRAFFRDKIFLGAGYRFESAAIALAGIKFGQFDLSYSYDLGLDQLKDHHTGSHEILLGYRFQKKEKGAIGRTPWQKRNRIYSPTDDR